MKKNNQAKESLKFLLETLESFYQLSKNEQLKSIAILRKELEKYE